MTKPQLYAFLSTQKLGVLSSVCSGNTPQSALIGIAITPELEIVFDTVKTSRKYANLVACPNCSLVAGWHGETTVQYEGVAEELTDGRLEAYKQVYFAAFPDGPERERWPGIVYFRVRPRWVRFSDFSQRPPRIEEIQWP